MENRKISFSIITGAFGSITASLVIYFFTSIKFEFSIIISLSLLLLYLLYLILEIKKKTIPILIKQIGIDEIIISNKPNLGELISQSEHSLFFWGISAKRTTSTPELKRKLIEIGNKDGDIRFLLFNPLSTNLRRKAEDEGDNYKSWEQEINATIQRLKDISAKHKINIKIRLYDKFPVWRALIIDKKVINLNYFQTGKQGPQSPMIRLVDKTDSLFNPVYTDFIETWKNNSTDA